MLNLEMSGRASSPVLVGRDEQMAALDAAFVSVRQGGPSAVLLGGEAGVGKSRLVGEFGRTAAAAGARVLTGGCLELGTDGLPFAPFTAILRDLVHEMGADALASMLPGRTTRGLARLLPELEALDLTDTLPGLDCPIVMVQGRHDQVAPASSAERYAELLKAPSKQFVWFEHSAHLPHLEEPERFREVLAKVRLGLPANSVKASARQPPSPPKPPSAF